MSQQIKNKVARLLGLHQLLQQNVVTLLEIQQYYKQEGLQKIYYKFTGIFTR